MKYFLFAFTFIFLTNTYAQIEDTAKAKMSAFQAAKKMDDALVSKKYDEYVDYNHPKVIAQTEGGHSGLVMQTVKQIKTMEQGGTYITAAWPGKVLSIVDTASEWQCTIPLYMNLRVNSGSISTTTTLIGISPDKGEHWYFVDISAGGNTLDGVRKLFPKLSHQLVVLPPSDPEFKAD